MVNWVTIALGNVFHIFIAKPLPEPMLGCQFDLQNKIQWHFNEDVNHFFQNACDYQIRIWYVLIFFSIQKSNCARL